MKKFQSDSLSEAYFDRNQAWLAFAKLAQAQGLKVARRETDDPKWPVVYIELPNGQVANHIPKEECDVATWLDREADESSYDGHDLEIKRERMEAFITSSEGVS